jgi:hypothetical protein
MADSGTIAGISIATIALIIALVCLGWIIVRQFKERKMLGLDKLNDTKFDVFKGGF